MIYIALEFAAVFVASLGLTGLVLWWLRHRAILDHPNDRSSHSIPVPKGGGLAVTTLILFIWLFHLLSQGEGANAFLPILSILLLTVVSWLDDLRDSPFWLRLGVQFAAVILALPWVWIEGGLTAGMIPIWVEIVLLVLAWVGFVNFFNFMDGIDGISGVEAIGIAGGSWGLSRIAALPMDISQIGLVITAACFGFLWWNWHPAKIFLGDVGSVPLGFILGGLLIKLAGAGLWAAALILPLYYLADAGVTLCKRTFRRQKFWQAHREHCYQIAVQRGQSHARVSLAIALVNLTLIGLALLSVERPVVAIGFACLIVLGLMGWMVYIGTHKEKPL